LAGQRTKTVELILTHVASDLGRTTHVIRKLTEAAGALRTLAEINQRLVSEQREAVEACNRPMPTPRIARRPPEGLTPEELSRWEARERLEREQNEADWRKSQQAKIAAAEREWRAALRTYAAKHELQKFWYIEHPKLATAPLPGLRPPASVTKPGSVTPPAKPAVAPSKPVKEPKPAKPVSHPTKPTEPTKPTKPPVSPTKPVKPTPPAKPAIPSRAVIQREAFAIWTSLHYYWQANRLLGVLGPEPTLAGVYADRVAAYRAGTATRLTQAQINAYLNP
jgi:hypothetical protein